MLPARDLGIARIDLQRHQLATRRQRPRHPDRGIAAERADLENALRADRQRHQVQHLALRRRHRDGRQARRRAVADGGGERLVLADQPVLDIGVDIAARSRRSFLRPRFRRCRRGFFAGFFFAGLLVRLALSTAAAIGSPPIATASSGSSAAVSGMRQ